MVDVSGRVAAPRGVHHGVVVQAEHVDSAVGGLVVGLALVGDLVADESADVLDDHGMLLDVMGSIESQALRGRRSEVLKIITIIPV